MQPYTKETMTKIGKDLMKIAKLNFKKDGALAPITVLYGIKDGESFCALVESSNAFKDVESKEQFATFLKTAAKVNDGEISLSAIALINEVWVAKIDAKDTKNRELEHHYEDMCRKYGELIADWPDHMKSTAITILVSSRLGEIVLVSEVKEDGTFEDMDVRETQEGRMTGFFELVN